ALDHGPVPRVGHGSRHVVPSLTWCPSSVAEPSSIVYFDSSALVTLLIDEPGSDEMAVGWDRCGTPVSSRLAYPEVRAALAAAGRGRRLTPHGRGRAEADWEGFWKAVRVVDVTAAIAHEAGHLAKALAL